jgi:hypothetical protein
LSHFFAISPIKEKSVSDCCSTACTPASFPKKYTCPVNGKEYGQVSSTTIKHHIKTPWSWNAKNQGHYFCSDPKCEVVYFGEDDSVIEKAALRTEVGAKDKSENALVCYCYGITKAEAQNNPRIRHFVAEEIKQQHCACKSRNPSGECCLADFPKK